MRAFDRTNGGRSLALAGLIAFALVAAMLFGAAGADAASDAAVVGESSKATLEGDAASAPPAEKPAAPIKKRRGKAGITVRTGQIPHPPPKPLDLGGASKLVDSSDQAEPRAKPLPPAPPRPPSADETPEIASAAEPSLPEPPPDAAKPDAAAAEAGAKPAPKPVPKPEIPETKSDSEKAAAPERPKPAEQPGTSIKAEPLPAPELPPVAETQQGETAVAALPPEEPVSVANDALRIPFGPGGSELPDSATQPLQELAARLSREPSLRLQLFAFAAGTADNASQARRLSLARALAVRAVLIEAGVRSTRMDVRALGANTDEAPTDRVDVLVVRRGGG